MWKEITFDRIETVTSCCNSLMAGTVDIDGKKQQLLLRIEARSKEIFVVVVCAESRPLFRFRGVIIAVFFERVSILTCTCSSCHMGVMLSSFKELF